MNSIERRVAVLEEAMRRQSEETTYEVWLICYFTRSEVAAMRQYEATIPPPSNRQPRGRVTLKLMGDISATEYLGQRGIVVPPPTPEERKLLEEIGIEFSPTAATE